MNDFVIEYEGKETVRKKYNGILEELIGVQY